MLRWLRGVFSCRGCARGCCIQCATGGSHASGFKFAECAMVCCVRCPGCIPGLRFAANINFSDGGRRMPRSASVTLLCLGVISEYLVEDLIIHDVFVACTGAHLHWVAG